MKKILSVLVCILFALIVFSPLCSLICTIFGYKFTLVCPAAFAIAIFLLAAITVGLSIFSKEILDNKIICILVSVLTPCALINTGFYIRACGSIWIIASLLICVGCGYLTIRHGQPTDVKTADLLCVVCCWKDAELCCFGYC